MPTTQQPRLLTVSEVAARLGLHPQTVRRLIREGTVPAIKLGSGSRSPVRVPADELDRWLYDESEED